MCFHLAYTVGLCFYICLCKHNVCTYDICMYICIYVRFYIYMLVCFMYHVCIYVCMYDLHT